MKLTLTVALLASLLLLLPASGQYRRGRSYSRGGGRGRGLRRLAAAGLVFGAGTLFGAALARGRRDVSENEEIAEEMELFNMINRMDTERCMEKWVCDMMARKEDQLAEEERDIADLLMEDALAGRAGEPAAYLGYLDYGG
ncbi:uncharacterized protein LOC119094113 [Pollicipes pollicipes]|uniref:uncharacterized protein LOC119094113 n=1 Tax=Pollicipes pollicipes TaxID=41117 RepID=UPI0018852ADC|nr:uncharacterized protein LOC119094113 [Pollicipes pollicipes]